jgi:hypothetical protein
VTEQSQRGENKVEQELFRIENLDYLFWAYFRNKMTSLLLMIEHPSLERSASAVQERKIFLGDLYHHFLPPKTRSRYLHAFKWLNLLLDRYPNFDPKRIHKAIQMVGLIYEAFGQKMGKRMEAGRIGSEMIAKAWRIRKEDKEIS